MDNEKDTLATTAARTAQEKEAQTRYDMAVAALEKEDNNAYYARLKEAAELGHPEAMSELGWEYLYDSVSADEKENLARAEKLWINAARLGNVGAMDALGYLYACVPEIGIDYARAESWCKKAIEAGSEESYINLSTAYEGQGRMATPANNVSSIKQQRPRNFRGLCYKNSN